MRSTSSCAGEYGNAFCAVRPPGHHAERRRAMGFCVFNSVAVGAAHALAAHGLSRVAIVDFDVHHGNGTEEIFSDDPRVLMVSTFQYPLYPYSGVDNPAPNMVNVPLAAGSGSVAFRDAVRKHWLPALEAHEPELILISAGFDAHRDDPLAGLEFTEDDYAWVTRELMAVAQRHAQRPHRVVARRRLRAVGARAQRRGARARAHRRLRRNRVKRRDFLGSCALLSGMASLSHAEVAADSAPLRRYARARLVDIHGAPIRQAAIAGETNYVFQYPFAATPCFLLRLAARRAGGCGVAARAR